MRESTHKNVNARVIVFLFTIVTLAIFNLYVNKNVTTTFTNHKVKIFRNVSSEISMDQRWRVQNELKYCLKDFVFSINLNISFIKNLCTGISLKSLLKYDSYDILNIWKLLMFDNTIRDYIHDFKSSCFYNDSIKLVAIDAREDTISIDLLLSTLILYEEYWSDSVFVLSDDSSYLTILDKNNIRYCSISNVNHTAALLMAFTSDHVIMTNSITSFFLALYLPNRVIKSKIFCDKYINSCAKHWIDINYPFDKSRDSIPFISEDSLKLITSEEVSVVSSNNILYRKYTNYLSYMKGEFIGSLSSELHECCTLKSGWNKNLYANPHCVDLATKQCGIVNSASNKLNVCESGGKTCSCAFPKKNGMKWTWTSDRRGVLFDVDGKAFCNLLGNKTLYLIGDSTMEQQAGVLANNIAKSGGKCAPQVQLKGSDLLIPANLMPFLKERYTSLDNILPRIMKESNGYAIVVMTVGHHINDLGNYFTIIKWIKSYLKEFKAKNKNMIQNAGLRLLWKSQSPAHENCETVDRPSSKPSKPIMKALTGFKYNYWGTYPTLDRAALGYFADSAIDGFVDVSPLYLRRDSYSFDCSHFCVDRHQGSALDYLIAMLYEVLEDSESNTYLYQWD